MILWISFQKQYCYSVGAYRLKWKMSLKSKLVKKITSGWFTSYKGFCLKMFVQILLGTFKMLFKLHLFRKTYDNM